MRYIGTLSAENYWLSPTTDENHMKLDDLNLPI